MEGSVWVCLSGETRDCTEPIVGDLLFIGGREACMVRGSHRKPAGSGELNQQVGGGGRGRRGWEKQDHEGPQGGIGLCEGPVVVQNEKKAQLFCGLL